MLNRATWQSGLASYLQGANKEFMFGIQVETKACLDDLENILSVPGVDIAFVGPTDLSFSLGLHLKYDLKDIFSSPELQVRQGRGQTGCADGTFESRGSCRCCSLLCEEWPQSWRWLGMPLHAYLVVF